MNSHKGGMRLSASDLSNHLGCRHLAFLDLAAARGEIQAPVYHDVALEALQQRGQAHEAAYVESLLSEGLSIARLPDVPVSEAFERTRAAMREGHDAIVQATLLGDGWMGRADVLRRVERPAPALGDYSYEVLDTKLARETRGRTILQLCLYSDLLAGAQGLLPEHMHVVPPGTDFQPESFRVDDFMAYYRLVRRRLEAAVPEGRWAGDATYPDPCEQCDICRWWQRCDRERRDDDHLSLVAGISKAQIAELEGRGVETLAALAKLAFPLDPKPARGAMESYERVHEQARVQLEGRRQERPVYELLPAEEGFGLSLLPEPTPKDVFLDFEGARFAGEHGLEYLFGVVALGPDSEPAYEPGWALTVEDEKAAFERFIDDAMARWDANEGFHIYHYAPYEPSAIKRLMGRHATREDEVDRLLRGGRFVDLYAIVRHAVRASVESYSIKCLEPFFGYERDVDLRTASRNLQAIEVALEFAAPEAISAETREAVEGYNRDDCLATLHLRDWLESLRGDLVRQGADVPRPESASGEPSEDLDLVLTKTRALVERLVRDVPADPDGRTAEQQAQWILAQLLEWHRREDKALWWEYFRLLALSEDELLDERVAIAGLGFVARVDVIKRSVVDRYRFPPQETEIRVGDKLKRFSPEAPSFGEVVAIDPARRTIDIKKGPSMADEHARAVFVHEVVKTHELRDALVRIGEWVAENGIDAPGPYRAGRDLLLGRPPRLRRAPIERVVDACPTPLDAARKLVLDLEDGLLAIQGPPGSGKTHTGARMICTAVQAGLKVGITAVSHKVIRNLLDKAAEAAAELGTEMRCVQKVSATSASEALGAIVETSDNASVFEMLANGEAQVAAGTAWLWARGEAAGAVDILFVDEAGQISLANTVAVSQAARSVVLLGDPQQLEQPKRGSHPDGTDVSALEHLLGGRQTMPRELGLFLGTTWRLHPSICAFTSELFYESRLASRCGLERQAIRGPTPFAGSGLWFVPVEHDGNTNESAEEADAVASLVASLLDGSVTWRDAKGAVHPVEQEDILVVAPYNAHVAALLDRLPNGARVGTVDRFQGQEAPIVVYTMATSSPDLAPRGMEFLYSPSRLNVATSRARCACILVANPRLFEPECRTPRQMKLANAFCRYLEMARGTPEM